MFSPLNIYALVNGFSFINCLVLNLTVHVKNDPRYKT